MAPFKDPTGLVIGDVRVDWADQKGFYYPGECVAGKLFVRLDMVIQQCEKVLFMCVGESHAEWESGSGPDSATHGNHEIYFYETKIILGAQPPAKDIILNPQVIIYSFEFKLPNNLPPTACIFNPGRPASGTVLYTVRILIVTHPWGMLDSSSNIQKWVGFEVSN
jgi:sporulation-control protein spo0M